MCHFAYYSHEIEKRTSNTSIFFKTDPSVNLETKIRSDFPKCNKQEIGYLNNFLTSIFTPKISNYYFSAKIQFHFLFKYLNENCVLAKKWILSVNYLKENFSKMVRLFIRFLPIVNWPSIFNLFFPYLKAALTSSSLFICDCTDVKATLKKSSHVKFPSQSHPASQISAIISSSVGFCPSVRKM